VDRHPEWLANDDGLQDEMSPRILADFDYVRSELFPGDAVVAAAVKRALGAANASDATGEFDSAALLFNTSPRFR
jgi:hypothetical protein